ncbi:serine hydrolase domain-containing protein [Rathayibacter soli]|uniref:serine hydrolase domain-containing protein n=1 Tax=Rathayibacter soli TaxID=3144168 RepID=UPI0027E5A7EE|nr:serine hydrolase domain-containing protein [Glaciibacter superstes]
MAQTQSLSAKSRRALRATSIAIAAVVAFSGCSAGAGSSPAASSTATSTNELNPLSHAALASVLATSAKQNLVPGAFAVVTTPDGTVSAAYGTTELGAKVTPKASNVFRIGSVTKTMTAAVILQLVRDKKLALTDPIDQFIPGVPNGANITIADLLQMRSGLQNYLDTDGFASVFDQDMTHVWTPQQLVDFGIGYPAVSAPATAFDYSNTNTTLLGMVAEKLDGKPLADIFHDRLFGPLGMSETELPSAATTALPSPQVQGYQDGIFPINHRPPLSADQQAAAATGTLKPNNVTVQSPSWSWAAGGVISSAKDLMTWAHVLGSSKLLGGTLHQAWLNDLNPIDPSNTANGPQYGLGIEQIRFGSNRVYFHEGELPGFNTFVATDPAHGVTFVVWTNLALSPDGQPTAKAIAGSLISQLYRTKLGTAVLPATAEE